MRIASLPALLAAAVCVAGCGQKGPLVLPDAQHPHKKLSVPKPAAAPAREVVPAGAPPAAPSPPAPHPAATSPPAQSPSATSPPAAPQQ